MNIIREKFAEIAHSQWSGWMEYLFSKGVFHENGTWTMPGWAVDRWRRQMQTPFSELPEEEKETDRKEADKFMEIIKLQGTKQIQLRRIVEAASRELEHPTRPELRKWLARLLNIINGKEQNEIHAN